MLVRKYLIHDTSPGADILLAKAAYQGIAFKKKGHQLDSRQGSTFRLLHELSEAKTELADLSYPLDLPALSTVSFSTMGVEAFLLLFLLATLLVRSSN